MRTAKLGALEVSVIGLGCNNLGRGLDEAQTATLVGAALDLGVNFFDTARLYGNGDSERFLGSALGGHRDRVAIATKFGRIPRVPDAPGADREGIRASMEMSLQELGTDYIDLFQLHFPDGLVPIEETLEALAELVEEGTVREIGCCNFDEARLRRALDVSDAGGWPRFVSNQVEYSMVHRDPELNGLAGLCERENVALLPYYPLASGLLTGKTRRGDTPVGRLRMEKYHRFLSEENFDLAERLRSYATTRGLSMAQVALGWLLSRSPVPAVTPGATRSDQIEVNVAAADWKPSKDDLHELDSLLAPHGGPARAT
ncbi:MAG TPA: aldo/keto reductase [Acidimicrobiia bacterium]|nr:aldo/keto reductase [Acidimicrobiia bacterium]